MTSQTRPMVAALQMVDGVEEHVAAVRTEDRDLLAQEPVLCRIAREKAVSESPATTPSTRKTADRGGMAPDFAAVYTSESTGAVRAPLSRVISRAPTAPRENGAARHARVAT